jgi:anti-anti-sigma factor
MIDFEIDFLSDSIVIIKPRGKLDESTRGYFFDCIGDLLEESDKTGGVPKHVIVECNGLGFLSSAGMAALLSARNRIRTRGGKIYFTHLSSTIAKALEATKLNSLLAIYPTTKELLLKFPTASANDVLIEEVHQ